MAKAGLGKGNAFTAPGPSYAYLELDHELDRKARAEAMARRDDDACGFYDREVEMIKIIDKFLPPSATSKRIKSDTWDGISRARSGLNPMKCKGKCACKSSKSSGGSHHGTFHFLCQAVEADGKPKRKNFKPTC